MVKRDPGLQPERTELSWWRTALVMAVIAALVIRSAMITEDMPLLGAGLVVVGLAAATMVAGYHRRRGLAQTPPRAPPAPLILFLSCANVFACGCAIWAFLR